MAREFGVSRPTISTSLDLAQNGFPERPVGSRSKPDAKVQGEPEVEAEIVRLHQEGKENKVIAEQTGIHRNTVARCLDRWYADQGLKRPDGRSKRWKNER